MAFINKNVNMGLLLLLGFVLVSLTVITVFFQDNLRGLSSDYNTKLKQLNQTATKLEKYEETLEDVQTELSLKSEREDDLTTRYTDIKSEKELVESQKKEVEEEKLQVEAELESTKEDLSSTQSKLDSCRSEVDDLEDEVDDLEDDVAALKAQGCTL